MQVIMSQSLHSSAMLLHFLEKAKGRYSLMSLTWRHRPDKGAKPKCRCLAQGAEVLVVRPAAFLRNHQPVAQHTFLHVADSLCAQRPPVRLA